MDVHNLNQLHENCICTIKLISQTRVEVSLRYYLHLCNDQQQNPCIINT